MARPPSPRRRTSRRLPRRFGSACVDRDASAQGVDGPSLPAAHRGRREARRYSRLRNTGSLMRAESELLPLLETLHNSKHPTRRWLHCTRRDWICGKLRACARQRPGIALEVGLGAGVYLPVLAELYGEVVATDLDDAHLNHARSL